MTREQQLEIIRAACGKAGGRTYENGCGLTDVLLAVKENGNLWGLLPKGDFTTNVMTRLLGARKGLWNLRADNLAQQSDETVQFLADLLANNTSNAN